MFDRTVTLTQQGREGRVTYGEGRNAIAGYWEFGGGDVVATVSMGSAADWRASHPWAVERRAEILRFVADELLRREAQSCSAEIDETSGTIVLRSSGRAAVAERARRSPAPVAASARKPDDVSWVHRYRRLRGRIAIFAFVTALALGAVFWFKMRVLVIDPGSGAPVGSVVRTATHLAVLIRQLQPYTPSLHHDGSTERFTMSVFLVPLDGSPPALVRLVGDLPAGSYALARVLGSDGRTLWCAVDGLYGVDLETRAVVTAADVAMANPELDPRTFGDTRGMDVVDGRLQIVAADRSAGWSLEPGSLRAARVEPRPVARPFANSPLTLNMAAGVVVPPSTWLGVHSQAELERAYRPGAWLRRVESAVDSTREARSLVRGELSPSDDGTRWRIESMSPVDAAEYRNALFLRTDEKSEPLRVADPDSVLMLHTAGSGIAPQSTLLVSRIAIDGASLLWTVDTGIERFKLEQILPGERATAFVGTRPPVPDKVSEPLIVLVDHATGALATHSLWQ